MMFLTEVTSTTAFQKSLVYLDIVKIYLFWTIVHTLSVELYKKYCTSSFRFSWETFTLKSVTELLISPIYTQNPLCKSLQWTFQTSVHTVDHMTITFGTWLIGYSTGVFKGQVKRD